MGNTRIPCEINQDAPACNLITYASKYVRGCTKRAGSIREKPNESRIRNFILKRGVPIALNSIPTRRLAITSRYKEK